MKFAFQSIPAGEVNCSPFSTKQFSVNPPGISTTQPSAAQAEFPPLHKAQGIAASLPSASVDGISL